MEDAGGESYCPNCGEALAPSDYFCPQCGRENEDADGPPPEARKARERRDPGAQAPAKNGGWRSAGQSSWDENRSRNRRGARPDEQRSHRASRRRREGRPQEGGKTGPGAPESKVEKESRLRAVGTAIGLTVAGLGVPLFALSVIGFILVAVGIPGVVVGVGLVLTQFAWFVALGLWYLRHRGYDWVAVKEYLGVRRPTLKELGLIIATWLVMIVIAAIVSSILVQLVAEVAGAENAEPAENSVGEIIEQNPEIVFIAIAGMFLIVGPAEEILFRGVIQNRIRERFSKIPGIVVASMLFASAHVFALAGGGSLIGIAITVSILFVTSLGLGWIYEYTENIVIPTLLHGFHNSVIVAITAAATVSEENTAEGTLQLLDTLFPLLIL